MARPQNHNLFDLIFEQSLLPWGTVVAGFDIKGYKPWIELILKNWLEREGCPKTYIHMYN